MYIYAMEADVVVRHLSYTSKIIFDSSGTKPFDI